MTSALFDGVATPEQLDAREREHEVDRTPRGLVRSALGALISASEPRSEFQIEFVKVASEPIWHRSVDLARPLKVLDVCAGSGVWSSEARRLFGRLGIPVEITAVEIRTEEREALRRWADHVVLGDIHETELLPLDALGPFDLVIGNPHFTGLHAMVPELLGMARAVILLHTTQAFQRGALGASLVHAHPPVLELRIGQSVRFRHGVNPANGKPWSADSLCYSVTAWVGRQSPGSAWLTKGLQLSAHERRWTEPPGAESSGCDELPTAPGWVRPAMGGLGSSWGDVG